MLTRYFPIWALLLSALGLWVPEPFVALKPYIIPLLMAVMLGMGMTLRLTDFKDVLNHKKIVGIGILLQFLVMPFAAFALSIMFELSTELTIGMMLVGATAGGTASNVMTYLANGKVALSVSMTTVSTLLATFMLPLLTWLYIGQTVTVPVSDMLMSLIKLILLPVIIGVTLNTLFHKQLVPIARFFPAFSTAAIILIIAIVVALNHQNLATVGGLLIVAIMAHNLIGLLAGYWISRKLGYDSKVARTVAIEVGMQNSGLSVALALKYFSAASALPGALFSIWHNVSGSIFAAYFAAKDKPKN